jgi:hypothetical protein
MDDLPRWPFLRGQSVPPPERVPLHAGPLTLTLENGDIRYVRFGDVEVLRRIYVAVRDANWRTPPMTISNLQIERAERSFTVRYVGRFQQRDLDFAMLVLVEGHPDGTVRFAFDGVARTTFQRNRIGICVLHPVDTCAGRPFRARKADGKTELGTIPREIAPHQPISGLGTLTHEIVPGLAASIRFEGDVFEMEDQRNWTDASYKTYSTPLALPHPVTIEAGTRISQAVELSLAATGLLGSPACWAPAPTFTVGQPAGRLPEIGLGLDDEDEQLNIVEIERLRALNLAHLRIDLDPNTIRFSTRLRHAVTVSQAIDVPLEVALFLDPEATSELDTLDRLLGMLRPRVRRWLVFDRTAPATTDASLLHQARQRLKAYAPGAPIASGTDSHFTALNRQRPPVDAIEGVCFAISPQAHAFDESSLIETLPAQGWTVESARSFVGRLPIHVGPVTFRPRGNARPRPNEPAPVPGEPTSTIDQRQASLLGAGWTVGSIAALAAARAASITYYETLGWRGVLERADGPPDPARFRSVPGGAFPLYHVLADVGEMAGGEVLTGCPADPLALAGLVLRRDGRTRVWLANLTAERQRVTVLGLDGSWRVRTLDERTIGRAMRRPESFRTGPIVPHVVRLGRLELELLPYAVARLEQA